MKKIIWKSFKYLFFLLSFFGSMSFGISIGKYNHFPYGLIPYEFVYEIYKGRKHPSVIYSIENKNLEIKLLEKRKKHLIREIDSLGVYVTYGQSNTTNSGQYGYKIKNNIYEFYKNEVYKYQDPTIGGGITSNGGTVWGMLGDLLVENKIHNKVIFSISGRGGQTMEQLSDGTNYNRFKNDYQSLKKKYGKVDGILFHQGESNNFRLEGNGNYYNDFKSFLSKMVSDSINSKIYLSRVSHINYGNDKDLIKIQNKIIKDFEQVLEGPNTDKFNLKEDRLPDGTHFSLLGYEKFAKDWMIYLKN